MDERASKVGEALAERVDRLEGDEREILAALLARLERGHRDFGAWNVRDGRDYPAETYEEVLDGLHYVAAELVRQRQEKLTRKKRIYVCHPYRSDPALNSVKVRIIAQNLVAMGVLPVAPQLYLPQFINEETQRELALALCVELLKTCDEVWVFGEHVTEGMERELVEAHARRMFVRFVSQEGRS